MHLALLDQVIHRAQRFIKRRRGVGFMHQIQIKMITPQTFETGMHLTHDVTAR